MDMLWKRIRYKLYRLNVIHGIIIVFILTLPWGIYLLRQTYTYQLAKILADTAIVYFTIAFMLYPCLYAISHTRSKPIRRKLVIFTRVFIRFHIAVAIVGIFWIILHASWMLTLIPINSPKAITGLLTLLGLIGVLLTGYLRKVKSSGKRRRYHRYTAVLFILVVIFHLMI
jgi:hypothetical protein